MILFVHELMFIVVELQLFVDASTLVIVWKVFCSPGPRT